MYCNVYIAAQLKLHNWTTVLPPCAVSTRRVALTASLSNAANVGLAEGSAVADCSTKDKQGAAGWIKSAIQHLLCQQSSSAAGTGALGQPNNPVDRVEIAV